MKIYYENYIRLIRKIQLDDEETIFKDILNISKKENAKWISGQN